MDGIITTDARLKHTGAVLKISGGRYTKYAWNNENVKHLRN